MKEHHLQLNLAKTEFLVFPATPTLQHDFTIQFINNYPISFGQKSWCNLWWPADLQRAHCKDLAYSKGSCHFYAGLLQCSSGWISIKHNQNLQMIQNAAARLVFNEPKRAHVTPLFISLHWLPVAARIQFKTLMLAYKTTTGSAPSYFHSLLRIYIPSRSLRSASERRLVVPSQRGSKSLSRTFSFTVPGRWNDLPTPIWNTGSLSIFKQQLKTRLFRHYLTWILKKRQAKQFVLIIADESPAIMNVLLRSLSVNYGSVF